MNIAYLRCDLCTNTYTDIDSVRCECGGALSIVYSELPDISWNQWRSRRFSHWRYRELYPTVSQRLSLGEGGTPLIPAKFHTSSSMDVRWKLELTNPTGSFKDRGTAIAISHARDHADGTVLASTGNMGASVAAYSARAGLDCRVYVPQGTHPTKKRQMTFQGAAVIDVEGDYAQAASYAEADAADKNLHLMGDYHFRCEGEKSVAFEIIDQLLRANDLPDYIVTPIGNGTLLKAIWKGLQELRSLRLIPTLPHLIGVQSAECAPVVRAWYHEWEDIDPITDPVTVAGAIACGDPLDGMGAYTALQESDGFGITVTEREILQARKQLARQSGILGEEAAAVPFAGILQQQQELADSIVVGVITGHGLKTL